MNNKLKFCKKCGYRVNYRRTEYEQCFCRDSVVYTRIHNCDEIKISPMRCGLCKNELESEPKGYVGNWLYYLAHEVHGPGRCVKNDTSNS